jgi:hypothetical protein
MRRNVEGGKSETLYFAERGGENYPTLRLLGTLLWINIYVGEKVKCWELNKVKRWEENFVMSRGTKIRWTFTAPDKMLIL